MNRSIGILVLTALVQMALCKVTKETFTTPNKKCLEEAKLTMDDFTELQNMHEHTSFDTILGGNRACYILCVGKQYEMFANDGTPNVQALWSLISKEPLSARIRDLSSDCTNIHKDNPCETVKDYIECMVMNTA